MLQDMFAAVAHYVHPRLSAVANLAPAAPVDGAAAAASWTARDELFAGLRASPRPTGGRPARLGDAVGAAGGRLRARRVAVKTVHSVTSESPAQLSATVACKVEAGTPMKSM
jgi:hypothetical protein